MTDAQWYNFDAFDATCNVEVPVTVPATGSHAFGLGATTGTAPTLTPLTCLEVPAREVVNHENGLIVTTPLQLLINDPTDIVSAASAIQYNSVRFRITNTTRQEPTYSQVTLEKM